MAKKTAEEANGHDDDATTIPSPPGPVGPQVSDQELLDRQRAMADRNRQARERADDPEADSSPAPQPRKKNRADALYTGAKTIEGEEKKTEPSKKKKTEPEEDDDGEEELTLPGYASVNALSDEPDKDDEEPDSDPSEEGDQDEGEKTPPPKKKADPDVDKESNLGNLRRMAGDFRGQRDSLQQKVEELQEQLKAKPSSDALQRENAALKQRITELEPFQLTFGLHQHPLYRERKEKENGVIAEMTAIAKDYDVDEKVLGEFVGIKNRKERDEFLRKHFDSDDARQELKTLHQRLDGMLREREELEKKPAETLRKLDEQRIANEAQTSIQREQILSKNKEDGWMLAVDAVTKLPEEQRIYELIEVPGNKKHNEKVVRPTLNDARKMVDVGIGHIEKMILNKAVPDRAFVRWFTQVCQQASATMMVNAARLGLYEKLKSYEEKETKQNGYARPGVNPPARSKSEKKGGKKAGQTTAAAIFESVKRQTEGH